MPPPQGALPRQLASYLFSPSDLTVVTSVLGATGNWLILRFLLAALSSTTTSSLLVNLDGGEIRDDRDRNLINNDGSSHSRKVVVLVSFLRGWDFWRTEAKRLGLDLARLSDQGRLAFIDGISEFFYSSSFTPIPPKAPSPLLQIPATVTVAQRLPSRPIATRMPVVPTRSGPVTVSSDSIAIKRLHFTGRGITALDALEKDILTVVEKVRNQEGVEASSDGEADVLLVIDQPDLLLAATGPGQGIGATEMIEWVMGLEQAVNGTTVLAISADSPLIHNASALSQQQGTPLETEHTAFVVGLAHRAQMVMQLRSLDTGIARDVSGVMRISKGGAWVKKGPDGDEAKWKEKEVLYFVQRDAGVRVFERGE